MPRKPEVRNKNGHWYSEAGGIGRYYGKVTETTHAQATALLWRALAGDAATTQPPPRAEPKDRRLTVADLRDLYLEWISKHRSERLFQEAKRHLDRFLDAFGPIDALKIEGRHLEDWQDLLTAKGYAPLYVHKHAVTLRALYGRAVKAKWVPADFRPFLGVEYLRIDPKPLLEDDLPTDEEIESLFALARDSMADILRVYHATGCRTHELIEVRAADFQRRGRSLVLGKHKRSKTLKDPIPRTITLNPTAFDVLERVCEGRDPEDLIFPNRAGRPYTSCLLDDRFARLRAKARVRPHITLYSFRHLWISEALLAGIPTLVVARMAGTSPKMLEKVYAHFGSASFHEAQAQLDRARAARRG